MPKSREENRKEPLPQDAKGRWERPTLQRAGHLGDVLQDKGNFSVDDPGIALYKTPGHDMD